MIFLLIFIVTHFYKFIYLKIYQIRKRQMVFSILKSTNNGKRLFAGYYKYRGRCLSMINGWIAYLPPKMVYC